MIASGVTVDVYGFLRCRSFKTRLELAEMFLEIPVAAPDEEAHLQPMFSESSIDLVALTGIGLVMTEIVETVSGGNLILMLAMTAVICLILGMGMPTTASYVVVATLMAPVLVELAAENDLAVSLVAVHLFVFYFGLMADVTPPVGLAAYAAAAISGADPVKTGIQGFRYEIRTGLLPFIFIFNTEILLIDVGSVGHFIMVVIAAAIAMGCFVAGTQGWFLTKSRWYESVLLLLVCTVSTAFTASVR